MLKDKLQGNEAGFHHQVAEKPEYGKVEVGQHSLLGEAHCGNELEVLPGNVALGDKIIIEDPGVIKGERRVKRIGIKKKDDCREKNRTNILFRKMFFMLGME
jgi:hypothetical protein